MFRVEITDDGGADPYFLFLWSVSEDEFHELKQQQRLLVDFAAFPTSLIELLQCCLKDSNKAAAATAAAGKEIASADTESEDKQDKVEALDVNPLSRSQGPVPLRCDTVTMPLLLASNWDNC